MLNGFSGSMTRVAIAAASAVISVPIPSTQAQAPAATEQALETPWGEPDLQGIWTDEFDTPFQRPAKYAEQEFFTEAQRAELDKERTEMHTVEKEFAIIDFGSVVERVATPKKKRATDHLNLEDMRCKFQQSPDALAATRGSSPPLQYREHQSL